MKVLRTEYVKYLHFPIVQNKLEGVSTTGASANQWYSYLIYTFKIIYKSLFRT